VFVKALGAFVAGLWLTAGGVLFAGPEDSPLARFRTENHAAGGHRGRVNALAVVPVSDIKTVADSKSPLPPEPAENERDDTRSPDTATDERYVLTAGEDGFLGVWQQRTGSAVGRAIERYQLSALPVSLMKAHPVRSEIAYVETDGLAFHRLSAMNYWTKTPLFSLDFEDRITFIDYTAGGSFLVVAAGGRGTVYILDSKTGREACPQIAVQAAFAAASPSERTLVIYSPTGRLSYWNLQSGRQTAEFQTNVSLREPVIFRNYNLLAGWVNNELFVINATNGRTLIRDQTIPQGILFPVAWDDEKFAVFSQDGVTVYAIDDSGILVPDTAFPATGENVAAGAAAFSAVSTVDGFFLGTGDGTLLYLDRKGGTTAFTTETQVRVTDALVYDSTILYATIDGRRGKMAADYEAILAGAAVPLPARPLRGQSGGSPAGFPVSELNGKLLYLEAQGPVVRAVDNEAAGSGIKAMGAPERELLSMFLPLTIDADFADDETIIIAGMFSTGGSLLQLAGIATGETVPIEITDGVALKVYRGKSGGLYTAVSTIAQSGDTSGKTYLIKLDPQNPRKSRRLVEIGAEDDMFDIAESGGNLVTNLGSMTADFYDGTRGNFLFSGERAGGLPVRILDGGSSVIVVDDEGSIVWLDGATGRIQALMRIYEGEWEMAAADTRRVSGR
jgi:outer membrane protein assembly factor BamB